LNSLLISKVIAFLNYLFVLSNLCRRYSCTLKRSVKWFVHKIGLIGLSMVPPPTRYWLYERWFYRSKDPTNSIKVL